MVFLPSAEIFQEETAFSVSRGSRALFKAVGNPATGILPVCQNSFGVRIETSKKSALLGNQSREISQSKRERERERERERATHTHIHSHTITYVHIRTIAVLW